MDINQILAQRYDHLDLFQVYLFSFYHGFLAIKLPFGDFVSLFPATKEANLRSINYQNHDSYFGLRIMDLQFWKVEISFTREKNTDFNVELFDMKVCVETTIETS